MDLTGVDGQFTSAWTGPIQAVFNTAPIPAFINELQEYIIYTGGHIDRTTNAPLAFAQRKALQPGDTSKIVAERVSCRNHIKDALLKQFPHKAQHEIEDPDLVAAIDHVVSFFDNPGKLVKRRNHIIERLKHMQTILTSHDQRLETIMPPTVLKLRRAFPIRISLLYVINCAISGPDFYMPHAFVTGFPMVGRLHKTGVFRAGFHPRTNFEDTFEEWNASLIRSIRRRAMKFKDPEHQRGLRECHEATMKEVSAGYMDGPFDYEKVCSELKGKSVRAMRRFPQYRFPGAACRPCDHGGEPGTNDSFETPDKLITENSEFPLRNAIMYRQRLPRPTKFRISTNDLKKAYRQMPSGHPEVTVVALWNPAARRVEFFIVYGLPFGLAASVLQFNRPMEAMIAALRRILGVPSAHYYDDVVNAGPAYAAKSDDDTTRSLFSVLRFEFDDDKHQQHADSAHFLGVSYDVSHFKAGVIYVRIKPERKAKIAAMLQEIITKQQMTKGQASSLRGKLFFACTQAFGRVGRAALQAFVQRQYSNETNLTPSLVDAVTFFQQFIDHADAMPRTYYIDASLMPPILIWTDASWENMQGMLGSVVYVPELQRFFYSYTSVPDWMTERWTPRMQKIGQAEILAAILPYLSIPVTQLHRRNVIHFVDNTSAISALLNGYSKAPDSAWMVNNFHAANTKIQANIWWEHVDSKANCSDMPSRGDFEFVDSELHATFYHTILDEYAWSRPAYQWFY